MTWRSVPLSSALIASLFLVWGCTILGAQDQRLGTLESKVESLQKSKEKNRAEISAQVEEMTNTLLLLESELEGLQMDLEELRAALASQALTDTTDKSDAAEGRGDGDVMEEGASEAKVPGAEEPGRSGSPHHASASPMMEKETALSLYRSAMEAYNQEHYQEAATRFREFISQFPKHNFSDNAQYWIGECYYSLGQYERSIDEFCAILQQHENEDKVADALLKIGLAYLKLDAPERARPYLLQLIEKYPASESAGKARREIGRLAE